MTDLDLPPIGLGTSGNDEFETCAETVADALAMGYRHVDTAQMYDNERAVGEGIRRAAGRGVNADEVIVATKIHPDNLGYDDAIHTAHESLDRLGLDTVDVLYVHWPISAYDPADTLAAIQQLYDDGVTEYVGLSNFTPELLDDAREQLDAPIAAHQVECHPLLPQTELREYARTHDHWLVAYSPLGAGELLDHPAITEIARDEGVSPATLCLAWAAHKEPVVPIPKGTGEHVRENVEAITTAVSQDAIDRLDAIDDRTRVIDPDAAAWND